MININFSGLEDILNDLKAMGDALETKGVNNALKEGAKVVKKELEAVAPKSDINKPHAKDNIKISRIKNKNGEKSIDIGWNGTDHFYMRMVDLGTSKMPPTHFKDRAYTNGQEEVKAVMREEIRKVIESR